MSDTKFVRVHPSTGMTLEEVISEVAASAEDGIPLLVETASLADWLEDLQDHYAAADALAAHLGIAPQDAPAVADLVAMVPTAMEKARQQGRDEARLAAMEVLAGIPHEGAYALSVAIQNAIAALK